MNDWTEFRHHRDSFVARDGYPEADIKIRVHSTPSLDQMNEMYLRFLSAIGFIIKPGSYIEILNEDDFQEDE